MIDNRPIIAITPGEPAGIGPDITLQLAASGAVSKQAVLVAIADPHLLNARAEKLGIHLQLQTLDPGFSPKDLTSTANSPGEHPSLYILPVGGYTACDPGNPEPANARYILETLSTAVQLCREKRANALVTGPVNKHLINQGLSNDSSNSIDTMSGGFFSGHTEFLADQTGTKTVVMMLAGRCEISKNTMLRVALATTHLPLADVARTINTVKLEQVLRILNSELTNKFSIDNPRILVCGLNPHAGEQGDLGSEEQTIINPLIAKLRAEGFDLSDTLPADTLFTPHHLADADAVLAMYHDQGLPVLKSHCFGKAANITLGLPIVRTSVDHGTAFELAGTGNASTGSLETAVHCAITMCKL